MAKVVRASPELTKAVRNPHRVKQQQPEQVNRNNSSFKEPILSTSRWLSCLPSFGEYALLSQVRRNDFLCVIFQNVFDMKKKCFLAGSQARKQFDILFRNLVDGLVKGHAKPGINKTSKTSFNNDQPL